MFDARFVEHPVGRARGGRSMEWNPVGTVDAGKTVKARHLDTAMEAVSFNALKVAAAAKCAKQHEYDM
jgi:hypothetical protein